MTEKQEIRAKSAELALKLIDMLGGTNRATPKEVSKEDIDIMMKVVFSFSRRFEDFIWHDPESGHD